MMGREWTRPRVLSFAACATLTAACAGDEPGQARIQADMDPVRSDIVVDDEPVSRVGWTSGDPEFGGVVDGAVLDDSTAVVLDAQRGVVTFLSTDGRWLELGGLGGAPGEFGQLHSIVRLPRGGLGVQDVGLGRLTIIDSGEVIETLTSDALTRATVLARTAEDGWVTGPPMPAIPIPGDPGWVSMPVIRWDRSFLTPDTLFVIDYADMSVPTPFPFEGYVAATEERFAVASSEAPRVDWRDREGEVVRSTDLVAEPARLDDAAWAQYVWGTSARIGTAVGDEQLAQMLAPQRAEASDFLPYLGSLWFDQDGRLWVGRYAPDFWHPGEYQVIEPRRGHSLRVSVPGRVQVLDAGGGILLAVERDDLGVEAVSIYSFAR